MADRWTDEREELDRLDRERGYGRYRRYASDEQSDRSYSRGERSFQPRDEGGRGRVFGERESGIDYTGPRYGAGGYYGYGAGRPYDYGRDHRGGRFYGDDGRQPIYQEEYAPYSITRGGAAPYSSNRSRYSADRHGEDRRSEEHAYRVAYGEHHPDHKGHYEDRDDRLDRDDREGRNFWERASDRVASWFEGDDDRRERGGHRGRGPSGYKRTDERISDEVHERLTDDPWLDASGISVAVSGGEVTLSGTVVEREAKHRAERLIEDMSGVTHVQNNLRVRNDPITGSGHGFGDSANAARVAGEDTTDPTLRAGKGTLGRSN